MKPLLAPEISPYMTAEELVDVLRFPSLRAAYRFLETHPDFPRLRRGRVFLFDRRAVDAWLRGDLKHSRSVSKMKLVRNSQKLDGE